MTNADPDLDLLASLVGNPEHFVEHHWGRRPLHRNAGDALDGLLTVGGIEELLVSSARYPTFRLVRDGMTLPRARSSRTVRLGGKDLDDVADLSRIAAAVDDGATLVMQGLQRTSLHLARFCRSLERAISHPVQANAYLSPPGSAGLRSHRDDHDVLALQLAGTKVWAIEDLGTVRTSNGDVLYIPAGVRHEAAAQHEMSLHVTIGIVRVSVRQAVQRALAHRDLLAAPLPLGYARPEHAHELHQQVSDALNASASALHEVDPAAVAATERSRAHRRRSPLPIGQLASILRLDSLDQERQVAWRGDVPAAIGSRADGDGRFSLDLPDRRITFPDAMRPAVERLMEEGAVTIGSLPGLDDASRLVLVRRLVRETVLVVDEASGAST